MCRASKAFKTEVLKNRYKKIWIKNQIPLVKNKFNVGLKDLNFECLAAVGGFNLQKTHLESESRLD